MIDSVIVTMVAYGREFDLELPAHMLIIDLKPILADSLHQKGISLSSHFDIACNGNILLDGDTLYSREVWDGSILTIV